MNHSADPFAADIRLDSAQALLDCMRGLVLGDSVLINRTGEWLDATVAFAPEVAVAGLVAVLRGGQRLLQPHSSLPTPNVYGWRGVCVADIPEPRDADVVPICSCEDVAHRWLLAQVALPAAAGTCTIPLPAELPCGDNGGFHFRLATKLITYQARSLTLACLHRVASLGGCTSLDALRNLEHLVLHSF